MQTRNVHQNIWINLHNKLVYIKFSNHQKWFETHTTWNYISHTKYSKPCLCMNQFQNKNVTN